MGAVTFKRVKGENLSIGTTRCEGVALGGYTPVMKIWRLL